MPDPRNQRAQGRIVRKTVEGLPPEVMYREAARHLLGDRSQAERRIVDLARWAQQVTDALDGRPLPEYPDAAPARIERMARRIVELEEALRRIAQVEQGFMDSRQFHEFLQRQADLAANPSEEEE